MTTTTKRTEGTINFTESEIQAIRAAEAAAAATIHRERRLTVKQFEALYGVHISTDLSGKLLDVWAITTSVLYNPGCQARTKCDGMICKECYANASLEHRPSVRKSYGQNTAILTNMIIPYGDIPYIASPSQYLRFESHGELINEIQVVNYFNIAKANPHLKCALWTKNPWIVKKAIQAYGLEKPENLVIIGSSYFVDRAMEMSAYDFIDKVFTVYSLDYVEKNGIEINCGSRDCANCGRCYENKGGRHVAELRKADQQKLKRRAAKAAKAAAK